MSSRFPIIAFISVVAIGAVGFEEYRIADLKKKIATHQAYAREMSGKASRQATDVEELEKKTESFKSESVQLRQQLASLKANQGDASEKAKDPEKRGAGDKWMKGLAKMFTDPEMKKSMRTQQMVGIRMMYADLAKELGLDAQETEQLIEILVDRQMDMAAAGMTALDSNNPNKSEDAAKLAESGKRYEDQIKAILGAEKFAKLQGYESTMGDRFMLQQFEGQFSAVGAPLAATQKDKLLNVMREERGKVPAKFNIGNNSNTAQQIEAIKDDESIAQVMTSQEEVQRRVLARSREFLSADQVATFEKVQKQQLDLMKTQIKMSKEFLGLGK